MVGAAALQIDGLPDARERAIPALLAERDLRKRRFRKLARIVGRAVHPDLDLGRPRLEVGCNVKTERQEAALVRPDEPAVHPDAGVVEHGAETKEDVLVATVLLNLECAA